MVSNIQELISLLLLVYIYRAIQIQERLEGNPLSQGGKGEDLH